MYQEKKNVFALENINRFLKYIMSCHFCGDIIHQKMWAQICGGLYFSYFFILPPKSVGVVNFPCPKKNICGTKKNVGQNMWW